MLLIDEQTRLETTTGEIISVRSAPYHFFVQFLSLYSPETRSQRAPIV